MNPRVRQQRSVFLLFLGACFVALIVALPMVTAQTSQAEKAAEAPKQSPSAASGASPAATTDAPDFDQLDRNKDGFIDKSEAGAVPGLSANFERADRSGDGKLDREEFARGLQILQVRR